MFIVLLMAGSGAAALYGGEKMVRQQAQPWVPSPPAAAPATPPSSVTVTQAEVPPDSVPPGVAVAPPVLPTLRLSASPPAANTAPAPGVLVAVPAPSPSQTPPAPLVDLGVLGLIGATVGGP